MGKTLGLEMMVAGLAVQGRLHEDGVKSLLLRIVDLIDMDTAGMEPAVWNFPLPDGRGGVGQTIAQPMTVVQPLVESFVSFFAGPGSVTLDTWSELEGFYLMIHSCRLFDVAKISSFLEKEGYPVTRTGTFCIGMGSEEQTTRLAAGRV